ncbi:hypothetical protein ACLB2K_037935 [Fragaria x ananassa]
MGDPLGSRSLSSQKQNRAGRVRKALAGPKRTISCGVGPVRAPLYNEAFWWLSGFGGVSRRLKPGTPSASFIKPHRSNLDTKEEEALPEEGRKKKLRRRRVRKWTPPSTRVKEEEASPEEGSRSFAGVEEGRKKKSCEKKKKSHHLRGTTVAQQTHTQLFCSVCFTNLVVA